MKKFSDYCLMKEEETKEDNKGLGDIDAEPNEDDMLLKMAKIAISRHPDRLIEFFRILARTDEDLKHIFDKYRDKRNNYLPKELRGGDPYREKDVIANHNSDMSDPI